MRRPQPSQGSLFAAIVTTVGSHEPNARLQKIDVALGFVGFFALFSVVRTAASTLQGAPSALEALVAALFVGLGYRLLRRRQALSRRIAGHHPSQRIVRHVPAGEGVEESMATVKFENAQRWYPGADEPAVPGIDLEIKDGEFMVLVGPSGCGKSTTLRMLAGLEEVNSGRIFIGDREVTYVPPKDRDIAMVFQNYALYPHMSVADNMAFALKMAKVPEADRRKRVNEAAKMLGLTEFLERKPKALSGGQRQRVAMGRAIVRNPQVFCMDEPLSNLDAKMRVQTRTDIAKLQRISGSPPSTSPTTRSRR